MLENIHFVLGFFVPIALAGGAGYILGRFHERTLWNAWLDNEFLSLSNKKEKPPAD